MAIADIKKVRTKDSDLEQVQSNLSGVLQDIRTREVIDGRLIKDVVFTSPSLTQSVNHGLGNRRPMGWIVVRKNAEADVWETTSGQASVRIIKLNASAAVTVDLWVF